MASLVCPFCMTRIAKVVDHEDWCELALSLRNDRHPSKWEFDNGLVLGCVLTRKDAMALIAGAETTPAQADGGQDQRLAHELLCAYRRGWDDYHKRRVIGKAALYGDHHRADHACGLPPRVS